MPARLSSVEYSALHDTALQGAVVVLSGNDAADRLISCITVHYFIIPVRSRSR